jgi:ComF family protein
MGGIGASLLDFVLPRECVGCEGEGTWVCQSCTGLVRTPSDFRCPFCTAKTPRGRTCDTHRNAALESCLPCGFYHDPILQGMIRRLKYGFTEELSTPLATLAARMAQKFRTLLPPKALVIPIPLSKTKFRQRGFNQTLPIATAVALTLGFPLLPNALIRVKNSLPQARLQDAARRTNMADAFVVSESETIKQRNILLIDDVATTGTTLEAAARPLKNAGATSISALVLARG